MLASILVCNDLLPAALWPLGKAFFGIWQCDATSENQATWTNYLVFSDGGKFIVDLSCSLFTHGWIGNHLVSTQWRCKGWRSWRGSSHDSLYQ